MSFSFDDDIQLAQRLTQEELPPEIEEEARAALDRLLQATANSLWDGKPNTRPAIATLLTSLGGLFNPAGVPAREKRLYSRTVDFRYTTRGSKKSYATLTRHIDIAMRMHELREEKGAAGKVADEFGHFGLVF
jgi:hypothetical protein